MFTPPPSPQPSRTIFEKGSPPQVQPVPVQQEVKKRMGARVRWAAILTPAILIFITLSTRYITHYGHRPLTAYDLLVDLPDEPPKPPLPHTHHENWHPRHRKRDSSSSSSSGSLTSSPPPPSSTPSGTPTSSSSLPPGTAQPLPTVPSSPPVLPTPFPQPWDQSLGQNFSSVSCFNFFQNMTNTTPFRTCRPFSLLQQSSTAMIQAQGNLTLMNAIIWGTCNTTPTPDQCSANMQWFATQLQTDCADDLKAGNTNAVDALAGLQAYTLMRAAACDVDPNSNTYCYLDAVHNSNPSDLYYYNLALGLTLPKSSVPTCSSCTKNLMEVYWAALSDPASYSNTNGTAAPDADVSQFADLQQAYSGAQQITSNTCGSNFAKTDGNGALSLSPSSSLWLLVVLLLSSLFS